MKKLHVMAAVAIFAASFVGCGKDDNQTSNIPTSPLPNNELKGTLTGTEWVDVSKYTTLKVFAGIGDKVIAFAEAPITNSEFSVILPVPPAESLEDMSGISNAGIGVSNKAVKYTSVKVDATYSNGTGTFFYAKKTGDITVTEEYWYVDDDVVIDGTVATSKDNDITVIVSMNLKKGWNIITLTESKTSIEQKTGARTEGLAWTYW